MAVVKAGDHHDRFFDVYRNTFGMVVIENAVKMAGSDQCDRDDSLSFTAKRFGLLSSYRFRAKWAFGKTD